jgi:hypothetical protein
MVRVFAWLGPRDELEVLNEEDVEDGHDHLVHQGCAQQAHDLDVAERFPGRASLEHEGDQAADGYQYASRLDHYKTPGREEITLIQGGP